MRMIPGLLPTGTWIFLLHQDFQWKDEEFLKNTHKWIVGWEEGGPTKSTETIHFEENVTEHPVEMSQTDGAFSG